jgi:hypothetical protein
MKFRRSRRRYAYVVAGISFLRLHSLLDCSTEVLLAAQGEDHEAQACAGTDGPQEELSALCARRQQIAFQHPS